MAKEKYVRITRNEERTETLDSEKESLKEAVYCASEDKIELVYTYKIPGDVWSIKSISESIDVNYNEGGEHEFLQRKIN